MRRKVRDLRPILVDRSVQDGELQQCERGGLDEEGHEGECDAVLRLHVCLEAFAQLHQRIQLQLVRIPKVRNLPASGGARTRATPP